MTYSVRRVDVADPGHAHDFLEMQAACFPEDYPMAPLMADTLAWWFAFEDREDPVGFACLAQGYEDPQTGFLAWAGVMPQARGAGLQRRLIQVRLREAERRGYRRAVTYTRTGNHWSSNNLISCGFRLYPSSSNWATGKPSSSILYWEKRLYG